MAILFKRKIKCPRHFLLRPGGDPFVRIPNPQLKNLPKSAFERNFSVGNEFRKLRSWVYKRDKFGNKIRNDKAFYQPEISAAFAIEHIYDPGNPICKLHCKGRCLESQGLVNTRGIKRLNG